jgi:RNA recognition motif-containing protein
MKLYVGNFSSDMTEHTLRELFEPFGTVSEVKLIEEKFHLRGSLYCTIKAVQR